MTSLMHKAIFGFCGVMILLSFYVQQNSIINVDSSWHIYLASEILSGKDLYKDYIEVNFPFIYYFRTIPVLLSKILGADLPFVSAMFDFSICLVSLFLSVRVLNNLEILQKRQRDKLAIITSLVFVLFIMPFTLSVNYFGEKEHLLVAFILPYLLTILADKKFFHKNKKFRAVLAIWASLGFSIKPFFSIYLIGAELYSYMKTKDSKALTRLEIQIFILLGIVNILFLSFFHTEYLTKIVGFAGKSYMVLEPYIIIAVLANIFQIRHIFIYLFLIIIYKDILEDKLKQYFAILFILGILLSIIQFRDHEYYLIPASSFAIILLFISFGEFFSNLLSSSFKKAFSNERYSSFAITLFGAPFLLYLSFTGIRNVTNAYTFNAYSAFNELRPFVLKYKNEGPIIVFGTLNDAFPLITYSSAKLGWRFSSTWMLAGIANMQRFGLAESEKSKMIEDYYITSLVNDMKKNKPSMFIVNMCRNYFLDPVSNKNYGYLEYHNNFQNFSKLWSDYKLLDSVNTGICSFSLYIREKKA